MQLVNKVVLVQDFSILAVLLSHRPKSLIIQPQAETKTRSYAEYVLEKRHYLDDRLLNSMVKAGSWFVLWSDDCMLSNR